MQSHEQSQKDLSTTAPAVEKESEEWLRKFAYTLKTDEDRKVCLDLANRAYRLGSPTDFFELLLCMLLAQELEIERFTEQVRAKRG